MSVHYFSISYTKLNLFMTWVSGADLIRELQSRVTTSLWKNVLWLEAANHVTSFNQSVCFISLRGSYAKLKFVHEIVSRFNSTIYDSFWLCKIKSDFKSWYKISWMANQFEQKSDILVCRKNFWHRVIIGIVQLKNWDLTVMLAPKHEVI